jgi:undecaprenyl phosphate-alpha-L-ara4N flippase subunit ArnE
MEYFLIFISLFFTLSGQLLQKLTADKAVVLSGSSSFLSRLFRQQETWWAMLCLGLGALMWLFVLYYMDVSKAFPFLSLNFVAVMLISRLYLKEVISKQRWLGVAFISLGIVLVSLS